LSFSFKENIDYYVIYDEKIRKDFFELNKIFGINNLSELSKYADALNFIKTFLNKKRLNNKSK